MSTTATETEAERRVREEQEEFEREKVGEEDGVEKTGTEVPADGTKGELFDKSIYEREELQLPKVDGEGVDKIAISFSGLVLLDRSDAADVALMRRMKLGGEVTLMVEAKVAAKSNRFTTSREGELDAVVLEHKARVHTVYNPGAAELGDAA